MTHFHFLRPPDGKRIEPFAEIEPIDDKYGDAPRCLVCGRFTGSRSWLEPYRAQLIVEADCFPDIVVGTGPTLVVSAQLISLLQRHLTTSLDLRELDIRCVNAARSLGQPPTYRVVDVRRLSYKIDFARSSIKSSRAGECPRCLGAAFHSANRITISHGSWIGQPLFRLDAIPGEIILSEELAAELQRLKVWNCQIIKTEMLHT